MKSLAVFGGTFNPVHLGHEQIIKSLCSLEFIDEVLIIPSKIPPHKSVDFLASDEDRLNMCKIAANNFVNTTVCNIELSREGKSYTIDTLKELEKIYPDYKIYLTIGADMLTTFTEWKSYNEILKKANLIAYRRVGIDDNEFSKSVNSLREMGAEIYVINNSVFDVSSTEIREAIKDGRSADRLMSKEVYDYIIEKKVYGGFCGD